MQLSSDTEEKEGNLMYNTKFLLAPSKIYTHIEIHE